MPIEFRCPNCQQLLRTPDESAGKQARCPQCGQIAAVPGSVGQTTMSGPAPPNPFAEATAPPNPFAQATPAPQKPVAGEPFNPYASPALQEKVIAAGPAAELTHGAIDMGEVLGAAWRLVTNDLGTCAVAGLVYLGLSLAVGLVGGMLGGIVQAVGGQSMETLVAGQVINQLIGIIAGAWLWLGMAAWSLKFARTRQGQVGEFFAVGPYLLRGLGGYFLLMIAVWAPILVLAGIPVLIGWLMESEEAMVIGGIAGGVIAMVIAMCISFTYCLYIFFILDRNAGVLESFRLSAQYTKGNRLSIFAILLIAGILGGFATVCTCYLGAIIAFPYLILATCLCYLMATGQPHAAPPAPGSMPLKQV